MHDLSFDERQRGFIQADGSAENTVVLSAVMEDAWSSNNQLHVCFVDVRKSFDSVAHKSVEWVLMRRGIPMRLTNYIMNLYATAGIQIEVDGQLSLPIMPGRSIRQSDPLSSILFNLVIDEVLGKLPGTVGYMLEGVCINALAFACDLVLMASTCDGLQDIIDVVISELARHALALAPSKCRSLSLIPSDRDKKLKLITNPMFDAAGISIPQVGFSDV